MAEETEQSVTPAPGAPIVSAESADPNHLFITVEGGSPLLRGVVTFSFLFVGIVLSILGAQLLKGLLDGR